jgi:hypothetical protein
MGRFLLFLLGPYGLALLVMALAQPHDRAKVFYLICLLPALGLIAYAKGAQKSGEPLSVKRIAALIGVTAVSTVVAKAAGYFFVCERYFSVYKLTHDSGWILILSLGFFDSMIALRMLAAARAGDA